MSERSKALYARIPESLYNLVKEESDRNSMSMAMVVRLALLDHYQQPRYIPIQRVKHE